MSTGGRWCPEHRAERPPALHQKVLFSMFKATTAHLRKILYRKYIRFSIFGKFLFLILAPPDAPSPGFCVVKSAKLVIGPAEIGTAPGVIFASIGLLIGQGAPMCYRLP